ncbi:MAG: endoribonuclease YicC domain-containing protein, partial [Chitinivibrionales bacterium]
GKKMGFILQEMLREVNTVSSKANDLKISHTAVEMKNEIESIKEQSLNIE